MSERYLTLASGDVFVGQAVGAMGEVAGEVVFTTGMTGYLQTLTDPSYYGQIVVQTFPQVGDYGVIPTDVESDHAQVRAYIMRDLCDFPSNFRSEGKLEAFLKEQNVIAMSNVDTRSLTKLVREQGAMNGIITDHPTLTEEQQKTLREYAIVGAAEAVSCKEPHTFTPENADLKVVLWDFGAKKKIGRKLAARGCQVITVPASTTAEAIMALQPDGVMLSNGPGDPAECVGIIDELKKVMDQDIPIFGICLGHQLMALARGARTGKLKYGHRGLNQPVRDLETEKLYITSQNHGYAVLTESLPQDGSIKLRFVNANDGTCEGLDYPGSRSFSAQFHPEAAAGTYDTAFLFDRFINIMKEAKRDAVK